MHEHSFSFFSIFLLSCNNDEEAVPKLFKRFSSLKVAQEDSPNARGRQIILLLSCRAVACTLPPFAAIVNLFMGNMHTNSNCDRRYSPHSPALAPPRSVSAALLPAWAEGGYTRGWHKITFIMAKQDTTLLPFPCSETVAKNTHNLQVTGFLSHTRRSLLMQAPLYSGRQKLPQRIRPIIATVNTGSSRNENVSAFSFFCQDDQWCTYTHSEKFLTK